jgi:hypothetical protein
MIEETEINNDPGFGFISDQGQRNRSLGEESN